MLGGEIYDAAHPEFLRRLENTRELLWEYNSLRPSQTSRRDEIIRSLLGSCGERFHINQPFRCDYGCNIHIGEDFFANFNLTILDEAPVRIGAHAFIGPDVSIYTACHPLVPEGRNAGWGRALPITVGDDVWIGAQAVILPGVTVGRGAVVGAGSVVTRDIPAGMLAAGNPCRVLRPIVAADRIEPAAIRN